MTPRLRKRARRQAGVSRVSLDMTLWVQARLVLRSRFRPGGTIRLPADG